MKIKCKIHTQTPRFVTKASAKFDTQTGEVYDVEFKASRDPDPFASILSEDIVFKVNAIEYNIPVNSEPSENFDSNYFVENFEDYPIINTLNLQENLKSQLVPKKEKLKKLKI